MIDALLNNARTKLLQAAIVAASFVGGLSMLSALAPTPAVAGVPGCANDMCAIDCEWDPDSGTTCSSDECGHQDYSDSMCDYQEDDGQCDTVNCSED